MCPGLGEVQDSGCLRSTAQTSVESSRISDRASKTGLPCQNKRSFCPFFGGYGVCSGRQGQGRNIELSGNSSTDKKATYTSSPQGFHPKPPWRTYLCLVTEALARSRLSTGWFKQPMGLYRHFPSIKQRRSLFCNTHEIYFSDLLNFFSRYLAEVLLGILTMESSLLYLVRLQGVLQMQ